MTAVFLRILCASLGCAECFTAAVASAERIKIQADHRQL
jgi:hypothetical protein